MGSGNEWLAHIVFPGFILAVVGALLFGWWRALAKARSIVAAALALGTGVYRQTGGARLDFFNATVPFASMVVTPEAISITVLFFHYCFEKSEIRSLTRHRGMLSAGLRIEHSNYSAPSQVIFWATSLETLVSELERLGYVVR